MIQLSWRHCFAVAACAAWLLTLTGGLSAQDAPPAAEPKAEVKAEPKAEAPPEAKPADPAPMPETKAEPAPMPMGEMPPAAAEEKKEEAPASTAPATTPPFNKDMASLGVAMDTVWVMMTGFLVFWMQAGFALVETGLTRAKNAVNICMKNLLDFCFGSVAYWAVGFTLMFGNGQEGIVGELVGSTGWFLTGADGPEGAYSSIAWTSVPLMSKFFFQLVFAATTATIVSGAMAERTKLTSYMAYSFIVSLCVYPISGHWIWGGGWLADMGFWDFAGSTVVHSLGGWLSLVGAFVIGPRLGKFDDKGNPIAMPGHNLVLVTLGVFILWLGWFGFNPGSTMAADAVSIAKITCTTNLAGAAGTLFALLTARLMFGKWEATMALNGALAGLVGVTAGCAWVDMYGAFAIGAVAGVLVVFAVVNVEKYLMIDDPVGAISVHGICGAWGTLAVGLFATTDGNLSPKLGLFYGGGIEQLKIQAIGVLAVMAWGLITGAIIFYGLKYTIGLRVSAEEEKEGLDYGEHGNEAYHGFQLIADN